MEPYFPPLRPEPTEPKNSFGDNRKPDKNPRLGLLLVVGFSLFVFALLSIGLALAYKDEQRAGQTIGGCERTAPPWRSAECAKRK